MDEGSTTSSSGLLLAAVSSFFFALCSLLAKQSNLPPIQLSWFSFLLLLLISAPLVLFQKRITLVGKGRLFFLRSFTGSLFLITSFYSVELIPLGDASVLFYSAPVFTIVLAKLFLREPCTLKSVIFIIVIMAGIMLVVQPPLIFSQETISSDKYFFGVLLALSASMSEAIGNIILRELKTVHFSIIMFTHGLLSFLLLSVLLICTGWKTLDDKEAIPVLLLSVFSCIEQLLMIFALSLSHAGPVALVQASDIIFGYMFQSIFFGEEIKAASVFGAILVGVMVVFIARNPPSRLSSPLQNL